MAEKTIALELAAFLDAPEVRALDADARKAARGVAERFLEVCYGDLGKAPRLLDGEDVETALAQLLPARLARRDPLAEHAPAVLAAFLAHLESTQVVTQAYEIRRALESGLDAFAHAVRTGEGVPARPAKRTGPFVHRASKLGRNDPCSCGSGKKYKKCHGKDA